MTPTMTTMKLTSDIPAGPHTGNTLLDAMLLREGCPRSPEMWLVAAALARAPFATLNPGELVKMTGLEYMVVKRCLAALMVARIAHRMVMHDEWMITDDDALVNDETPDQYRALSVYSL